MAGVVEVSRLLVATRGCGGGLLGVLGVGVGTGVEVNISGPGRLVAAAGGCCAIGILGGVARSTRSLAVEVVSRLGGLRWVLVV